MLGTGLGLPEFGLMYTGDSPSQEATGFQIIVFGVFFIFAMIGAGGGISAIHKSYLYIGLSTCLLSLLFPPIGFMLGIYCFTLPKK